MTKEEILIYAIKGIYSCEGEQITDGETLDLIIDLIETHISEK